MLDICKDLFSKPVFCKAILSLLVLSVPISEILAQTTSHYDPRCPTNRRPASTAYDNTINASNGNLTLQFACAVAQPPSTSNRTNRIAGIWLGYRQDLSGPGQDHNLTRRKLADLNAFVNGSINKTGLNTYSAQASIQVNAGQLPNNAKFYFYAVCNTEGGDNIRSIWRVVT